ncbi:MAG: histidine--tRNA ligase, partial [Paracoccus sp. (in: a-proteobacteria)]
GMLADALEAVGIARGDYLVRINNRKVLEGVLHAAFDDDDFIGATLIEGNPTLEDQRNAVLRTIDKFDKVGVSGVRELLGQGRKDESGAFIDGVGLSPSQIEPVIAFLTARGANNQETLANLEAAILSSVIGQQGVIELREIADLLAAMGVAEDRAVIDPAVVRGLGYYTGP